MTYRWLLVWRRPSTAAIFKARLAAKSEKWLGGMVKILSVPVCWPVYQLDMSEGEVTHGPVSLALPLAGGAHWGHPDYVANLHDRVGPQGSSV